MRPLWAAALIVSAVFAAYAPTLRNGFVWDDHTYVERNAFVSDPANLKTLVDPRYYRGTHEVLLGSRPVLLASLLVDRSLWADKPAGYHATSALLHAANAVWVYALAAFLGCSGLAPLAAGLLFGLHPVQTEAVALISFRSELLAAFFVFISLRVYLQARRHEGARALVCVAASAGLFGLGLLSKETAIALPVLVLLTELFFPYGKGRRRRLTTGIFAFSIVACAYFGFWAPRFGYWGMGRSGVQTTLERWAAALPTAPGPGELKLSAPKGLLTRTSPWEWNALRADTAAWTATVAKCLSGYASLLVFPRHLVADRAPLVAAGWGDRAAWLGAAALCLTAFLAAAWRRRRPHAALGAAWLLVALVPALNIVPLYSPMAERYLYLPLAGLALAAGAWLGSSASLPALAAACLLAGAYGARTFARARDWSDDKSLFLSGPAETPRSSLARYNRGAILRGEGRAAEAAREYEEALRQRPEFAEAWLGLAAARAALGDRDGAVRGYEKAVALAPSHPDMALAYALHLSRVGDKAGAEKQLERALALDPEHAQAWLYLGVLHRDRGRLEKARACLEKAVAYDPASPIPHYTLGTLLERQADAYGAARRYRAALERDAAFAPARAKLGLK